MEAHCSGSVLMNIEIIEGPQIVELDKLSRSLGNVQLIPGASLASILRDGERIVGFACVQAAFHAAGSWVHPDYRGKKYTYSLREMLESGMLTKGIPVYFSFPKNDFERLLFAKYGPVKEQTAQIKELIACHSAAC
jgi:hypothetical protein